MMFIKYFSFGDDGKLNAVYHNYGSLDKKSNWVSDRDELQTMEQVTKYAEEITTFTGELHIPIDHGDYTFPRFEIMKMFVVGQEISKYFNGDSYPDETIKKISDGLRIITSTSGNRYFRYKIHQAGNTIKLGF